MLVTDIKNRESQFVELSGQQDSIHQSATTLSLDLIALFSGNKYGRSTCK
jgi:hypothetical protein